MNLIGSKKNLPYSVKVRREFVESENKRISIIRQCELLGLNRSSLYYQSQATKEKDVVLMKVIDEQYTKTLFYGYRRMTIYLQELGYRVNHKRVSRLMSQMGLVAIYPKPNLSKADKEHLIYPYLWKGMEISYANQVWATDITYIQLKDGFIYLLAIMDWYSRYVIDFEVSNSLEATGYVETLERSLKEGKPEIFNSDQGSQVTSIEWLKVLQTNNIRISMDGQGRCFDNIFVERLWRTVKYEEVYLKEYTDVWEAENSLKEYFYFYNYQRPHQSLGYQTPFEMYQAGLKIKKKKEQKEPIFDQEKLSQKSYFVV